MSLDNDDEVRQRGTGAVRYLAFRTRFLNPRLFSRATTVVDALEEGTCRPVVVKDAWRQVTRDREDDFYEKIEESVRNKSVHELLEDYAFMHRNGRDHPAAPRVPFGPYQSSADGPEEIPKELEDYLAELKLEPGVGQLFGLPTVTQADDVGEREVSKAARRHSGASSSSAPSGGSCTPAHEVYHRTVCGAQRFQMPSITGELNERSHMRLVMKMVGRPLYDFSSTRELVQAFRDAIVGTSPHRIH